VAGIILLTCVAVGIFVFGRKHHTQPVRYRSIATVRVDAKPAKDTSKKTNKKNSTTTTSPPNIALSGPQKFALRVSIREQALLASHLRPSAGIGFASKLNDTQDLLSLVVTAPTRIQAQTVARNWASTFGKARKADARQKIRNTQRSLHNRVTKLHSELRRVDAKLVRLMPIVYHGVLRLDAPAGNLPGRSGTGPPPVPEQGSVRTFNLAFERVQLLTSLTDSANKAAALRLQSTTPEVFATVVSQTPATRVARNQATTLPALGGLFGGLVFALGAALLVDRADRTIRDPEEAALTFSAPVLSIIPADAEEFAVIAEPNSLAAEAYRGLAAMSIATDRLPKAMMVSTPTGDAHAQVAANFAAALSRLGLKVALMAMSVDQDWYLEAFSPNSNGMPRLPELLERAHSGTLPLGWRDQLPVTEFAPNLVVVPPADEPLLHLPIDGLPALLQELAEGGIDVTVIAGPPLLEDADATIVAWATRNVLWAIIPGEVTRAEARAAAARMELAGVTPFGVVMVEPQTIVV
jgi:Mrp family chromosome partitioning ATPase